MKEVEAVKSIEEINTISVLLSKHHSQQMSDIWNLGINMALRISDLLSIKFSGIDLNKNRVTLTEAKTKKVAVIDLNVKAQQIINKIRVENPEAIYLFQSTSSRNRTNKAPKPLTRQAVGQAFKEVGETLDISLSTHSMRKTRGYHIYKNTNDIAKVMDMLRHSSVAVTLRYIGITQEDRARDYNEHVL
ncbi:tyrosine-type recombinase/integrase [Psychromonas antarctica]|uniref:tyrosine-type recombinase/integrase n=1 Tax=Psychromonas antarctica TaxID=67573 RepID=UPI001EE7B659|nr:tyrosine-type recombinase/integrase [Psychromonas antarctica]MCG6202509.1 tyrosine-type recombinase/integrase [Psychromonas antarctica]